MVLPLIGFALFLLAGLNVLKCYWNLFSHIHNFELLENPFKINPNGTKLKVIEKAILILWAVRFLAWWRHILFSLIKKTFEKQASSKLLGNYSFFQKILLVYFYLYDCAFLRKILSWHNVLFPGNFQKYWFSQVFLINENSMWRHQPKK